LKSEKIGKIWKNGKLNSEMIWKIWKISVLVIITPKDTSSSFSPCPPPPPSIHVYIYFFRIKENHPGIIFLLDRDLTLWLFSRNTSENANVVDYNMIRL
jgi:hypothetical protein